MEEACFFIFSALIRRRRRFSILERDKRNKRFINRFIDVRQNMTEEFFSSQIENLRQSLSNEKINFNETLFDLSNVFFLTS